MTVRVHSARVSYNGADRLDITRASATGHGLAFAPSWRILRPAIDARLCAGATERARNVMAALATLRAELLALLEDVTTEMEAMSHG